MYELLRPLLFSGDPERIHDRVLAALESVGHFAPGRALLRALAGSSAARPVTTMGLNFPHPLGLAAGFDKDARAIPALCALNFAFIEIGTVTPRPQPGNPKPRMWRYPEAAALVNALGFPGDGMHAIKQRLETLRAAQLSTRPIGINLGKNAATPIENALDDYADVLSELLDHGDYFVVNVSSPNTVGLRTLQVPDSLRQLLAPLLAITGGKKPLLLKIAPDLTDEDVRTAAQVVTELGLAGIVCANTSIRRNLVPRAASLDRGGLSGAPIFDRMHECLKIVRAELSPQATVIAVGGISSPELLNLALAAGADLAQIYTAFIYRGPRVIAKLLR